MNFQTIKSHTTSNNVMSYIKKLTQQILTFFKPNFTENKSSINNTNLSLKDDIIAQDIINKKLTNPEEYPYYLEGQSNKLNYTIEYITRDDKGVLEDFFYDILLNTLKLNNRFKISNNINVKINDIVLTPDLSILNSISGELYFIEIDEPYTVNTIGDLIPIHYKYIDRPRTEIIIDAGISIIRFSEEQIASYFEACVPFIKNIIENNTYEFKIKTNCWTIEESNLMIENRYRDTYLPFPFKDASGPKSNSSFRSFKIDRIFKSDKTQKYILSNKFFTLVIEEDTLFKSLRNSHYFNELNKRIKDEYVILFLFENSHHHLIQIDGIANINKGYINFEGPIKFNISNMSEFEIILKKIDSEIMEYSRK